MPADQHAPGAALVPLRPAQVEPGILAGEVVDDAMPGPLPVRVVQVARVVARHGHVRAVARNLAYVPIGACAVTWRLWESRSTARYERFMRASEVAGDLQAALEWEARASAFRRDRHQRRMDWLERPVRVMIQLPKITAGFLAVLAATGVCLSIATKRLAEIAVPFEVVARIVTWVAIAVSVSYGPVMLALPWIGVAALWWAGRRHASASMTGWAAPPGADDADTGLVVTADTIVVALQHLRGAELKAAFKAGWRPVFRLQPVREGRGYAAVLELPLGVTPEMIADQRPVLARNLHRSEIEVWPSDAAAARGSGYPAGSVALWIADPGAVSAATPEYPLMHEGAADVFTGVPGGVSPRGEAMLIPVVANNGDVGGQQGQGKSNACRVVILGCALDPLCEIDVFVFAGNGDFDAYAPRLHIYRKGVEDDTIAAATGRLQDLYDEVGRREARLAELGAKKLTRQIAAQHPDLRPIVALFSECHELFAHPEFGELARELAVKTTKRSRKTGIAFWFDTQSSRKEAIPPALVELISVNCCFYVKTWQSNDGFLGAGSFQAGIRATELRPGRDRGTSLVTGISDAQFELLRWYFIQVDDDTGYDAAAEVIARAVAALAPGTRAHASAEPLTGTQRDLIEDLAAVLGDDRSRLADLPVLLRDLAPDWLPYRALTGIRLAEQLRALGIRVTNTGNVPRLDPADLRRARAWPGAEDEVS